MEGVFGISPELSVTDGRIEDEFITKIDVDYARSLSYLAIISVVKHSRDFTKVEEFLSYLDNRLPSTLVRQLPAYAVPRIWN